MGVRRSVGPAVRGLASFRPLHCRTHRPAARPPDAGTDVRPPSDPHPGALGTSRPPLPACLRFSPFYSVAPGSCAWPFRATLARPLVLSRFHRPLLCGLTVWCAPFLLCLLFSTESCVLSGHGPCIFPAQPAGSPSSLIPSDRHLINSLAKRPKRPGTWTLFPPTLSTGWGAAGAVLTLSQPDPSAYPADLLLPSPPQTIPVIIMGAISFEACVLGVVLSTLHII